MRTTRLGSLLGLLATAWLSLAHPKPLDALQTLDKRGGDTKYVLMHHLVGNTYPYTQTDWVADIKAISAQGVDAVALNYGADSWQLTQIASAYAAAESINSPLKLFLSPDFSAHPCDVDSVISEVSPFKNHPNQLYINGKMLVSSFEGKCLGEDGWATIKQQTGAYLMVFIEEIEGQYADWPSLDTWFCWGCAWPNGDVDETTAADQYYMNQLGLRYGTTVSPWLFTHYSWKNLLQKSDDWLYITRWEQLMAMRDDLTFVEMISWNDYGESHYMGPLRGAEPAGTTWTQNFPHTAWNELSAYYIQAFKTGSYPQITEDVVYYWGRPHPAAALASDDPLGPPQGWDWVSDTLWAVSFLASPGTITLTVGSSSKTFTNVPAGITRLSVPLSPGAVSVSIERAGIAVVDQKEVAYNFISVPETYNFNVYVGAARGLPSITTTTSSQTSSTSTRTASSTSTRTTSSTSTRTTTATSTRTTTSTSTRTTSSPTPTPTAPVKGWTHLGCYVDQTIRILPVFGVSSPKLKPSTCLSICSGKGYKFAGTEYGVECWCGSTFDSSSEKVDQGECNMPCGGDATKTCGSAWRADVFAKL